MRVKEAEVPPTPAPKKNRGRPKKKEVVEEQSTE
jgi:hypothetical protein